MKTLLILTVFLLSLVTIAHGQTNQRVHSTILDPPTACIPGHLYPNATTHKLYQGNSVGGCNEITGGAAAAAWGSITGTLANQTDLLTALGLKVAGPASAVDGHLAVFDSTTGKLIKDGGAVPSAGASASGSDGDLQMKSGSNLAASQLNDDGNTVSGKSIALTGVLGPELTTNGGFTGNATGWTLGTGWSYGSNAVTFTPNNSGLLQQTTLIPLAGHSYRIVIVISAQSASGNLIRAWLGGAATDYIDAGDGPGIYTFDIQAQDAGTFYLEPSSLYGGTIDSISVKEFVKPFSVDAHDGTKALHVSPFGNVGIGTDQPDATLNIAVDAPDDSVTVQIDNKSTNASENNAQLSIQTWGDVNSVGYATLQFTTHRDDALETSATLYLGPDDVFTLEHGAGMVMTGPLTLQPITPLKLTDASMLGCLTLGTDGSGVVICAASDARLKNVLGRPVPYGLKAVMGMTPHYFTWKDGRQSGEQLGMLAQDVQRVAPEAVNATGNGTLQINQNTMNALFVQSVKELNAKVEKLMALHRADQRTIRKLRHRR